MDWFIRRGANLENVYIDSRGYSGDVNKLLPKSKVRFDSKIGPDGQYAQNVILLKI